MNKFKWSVRRVIVQEIQVRSRFDEQQVEPSLYAVFKVSFKEREDPANGLRFGNKKQRNDQTIMCFEENLWKKVVPGERYSLSGQISFAYGNTFLCIEKVFDTLGIDITSEDSIAATQCFCPACEEILKGGGVLPRNCADCIRGDPKEDKRQLPF